VEEGCRTWGSVEVALLSLSKLIGGFKERKKRGKKEIFVFRGEEKGGVFTSTLILISRTGSKLERKRHVLGGKRKEKEKK